MSVARKTPKFADILHSRTPLKQPGKSRSPSPSRYLQGSPFSNLAIGNRKNTRNSPHSKMTLKESVDVLRQIRDSHNSVVGSGNKSIKATIYDNNEFESVSDFERESIGRDSIPMRTHISKIETFLASRKPKKEEDTIEPHNLAWRAASHDAQARLLKEGTPSNQWPNTNLLGQMGELYNKYTNEVDKRIPTASSPVKRNGPNISTRGSTRIDEDMSRLDQERYSYKENHISGRRSTKEGRFSHSSGISGIAEAYQNSGPSEIEKLKIQANKNKNQMRGKIDFINSLYEELAMQPRDKPLMPSNRPTSPGIDSKETPRSLSLVDDAEIEASISNRRRIHKREENREKNDYQKENNKEYADKYNTFGDDVREKTRLNSAQKIALRDAISQDDSLAKRVGASSIKCSRFGENGQVFERSTQVTEKRESPLENEEENNIGEDTVRRRESNRPPLPMKRQQGDSQGFESDMMNTRSSVLSREAKSTKNYIEMNKTSSGVKSKKYTTYEKVLRNVEELCKPLLETLKNVSTKDEVRLKTRCTSNQKGKWSPCSAISSAQKENRRKSHSIISSPVKEFSQHEKTIKKPVEGLADTRNSINCFYEEMNNLTLKITEAANVMQKTLDKLERYKVEDTERGDRSARMREGSPNGRRYGYNQYNQDGMY